MIGYEAKIHGFYQGFNTAMVLVPVQILSITGGLDLDLPYLEGESRAIVTTVAGSIGMQ